MVEYLPSLMPIEKVLLVDDEPDIRRLGALCLKSLGRWVVVTASNGDEAFDVALAELPDVIVMDVMMPGTDGPTALGKLKSNPKTKDIPIIFLTAVTKPQDIEHLLSLGACGVVAKPFEPKKLPAEIKRCVEQAVSSPQSSGGTEHA